LSIFKVDQNGSRPSNKIPQMFGIRPEFKLLSSKWGLEDSVCTVLGKVR